MGKKGWLGGIAVLLLAGSLVAAEGPSVRYRLAPDQSWLADLRVETLAVQTVQGYQTARSQTIESGYRMKAVAADRSGAVNVEFQCERVTVAERSPFETLELDTDQNREGAPERFAGVLDAAGRSFRLTCDAQGVTPDLRFRAKPLAGSGIGVERHSWWEAATAHALAGLINIPRTVPLALNQTWKRTLLLPSDTEPLSAEVTVEVYQISEGTAYLRLLGPVDKQFSGKYELDSGKLKGEILYHLAGTVRGEVELDMASGLARKATVIAPLTGEMRRLDAVIPLALEWKTTWTMRPEEINDIGPEKINDKGWEGL